MSAYYPHYATVHDEAFGYNERRGVNNKEIKSRYMNNRFRTPALCNGAAIEFMGDDSCYDALEPNVFPVREKPAPAPQSIERTPAPTPVVAMETEQVAMETEQVSTKSVTFAEPARPNYYPGVIPQTREAPIVRQPMAPYFAANLTGLGKESMTRRLDERTEIVTHIPGYQSVIPGANYIVGGTFGQTSRCLSVCVYACVVFTYLSACMLVFVLSILTNSFLLIPGKLSRSCPRGTTKRSIDIRRR
jgi:hypothetical protein